MEEELPPTLSCVVFVYICFSLSFTQKKNYKNCRKSPICMIWLPVLFKAPVKVLTNGASEKNIFKLLRDVLTLLRAAVASTTTVYIHNHAL